MTLTNAPRRIRRGRIALTIYGILLMAFLIAPTFILVPLSFSSDSHLHWPPPGFSLRWYENFVSLPRWQNAAFNSIQVSLLSATAATIIGTAAAFGIHRMRSRAQGPMELLILSPMVIPTVIFALASYRVFAGLHLLDTVIGLAIAYTVLALPLVFINVRAGLYVFDRRLEFAAASLGASPFMTFRRVTLPILRTPILGGALLALATVWDEAVIALFISGTKAGTLPKEMFNGIRDTIDPTIIAVASLLVLVSAVAVVITVVVLQRRSLGRGES